MLRPQMYLIPSVLGLVICAQMLKSQSVTVRATTIPAQTKLNALPSLTQPQGDDIVTNSNRVGALIPFGVFGTGLAVLGLFADEGMDSQYSILPSADPNIRRPNALVITGKKFPIGPGLADGPNSKWVSVRTETGGNPMGDYEYQSTFDLSGFDPTTAVLTGQFAAEGPAIIKLNGIAVGPMARAFMSWTPFLIASGFVPGVNTLDFVVPNGAGPTALRLCLSGTAALSDTSIPLTSLRHSQRSAGTAPR